MQVGELKRREFITLLGGAAAWPLAARAQQGERRRRIGVFMNYAQDAPQSQVRVASFLEAMEELGWTASRNVQIEYRWGVADANRNRRNAAELVAHAPDVIVTSATAVTSALLQTTRTIPIVFVNVLDPVGSGFVQSMARPGGNATGFIPFEYGMGGRWLELLKQIAPGVRRVAVLQNPIVASRSGQLGAIEALAPSLRVELSAVSVRDTGEIERTISALTRAPNGGLVIDGAPPLESYHDLIVTLAAQHRLPAVYPYRIYVAGGGLMSYGTDLIAQFRRAAGYVDRILKGDKPANLPVQAPTKYELVINRKTAKALGLTVPDTLLARADEVIE
jgi:putative ABC transport system substrate-binding protein